MVKSGDLFLGRGLITWSHVSVVYLGRDSFYFNSSCCGQQDDAGSSLSGLLHIKKPLYMEPVSMLKPVWFWNGTCFIEGKKLKPDVIVGPLNTLKVVQ